MAALLDPIATFGTLEFTLWGAGWGLLLWLGSFFWMGVLGLAAQMMEKPVSERVQQMGMMFTLHIVYGAVTGAVTVALV